MPRIRYIKPDLWTDGKVVSISPLARLMFIGGLNFAICDKGHLPADNMKLKLQILPADNVDADAVVAEILSVGLWETVRVESTGREYYLITRFPEHQKVDSRWSPSCPVCGIDNLTETPVSVSENGRGNGSHNGSHPKTPQGKRLGEEIKDLPIDKPMGDNGKGSEFNEFWKSYPRKVAKGQAEKAFRTARKIADQATIVAAVQAYARTVTGKDREFIAYPSTWLNGKRWLDEDIAPVTADALNDWLRDQWNNHDTAAITARSGLEYPLPDIPEDVSDAKAYVQQDRRKWISQNHEHILELILKREAVNA